MKTKILKILLASSMLALVGCPSSDDDPAGDGYVRRSAPATIDIMMHSADDFTANPIAAGQNEYHAFFEVPVIQAITVTETTDLSLLGNYHMLYIAQSEIDVLITADMTIIRDWTNAGGILMLNSTYNGVSAFGAFLGTRYEFTGVTEPDGDTLIVTDASHRLLTYPNVLIKADLDNWGNTTHGAFSSVGSAYSCIADDTDGVTPLPTLCATPYGSGAIIITGIDPECDCHDDHLVAGTYSGSEMWENMVMLLYNK